MICFAVTVRRLGNGCQWKISDTYHLKIVVEVSSQDVIVSRDSEDCHISLFINFDSFRKLSSLLLYFKYVLTKKKKTDKVMSDGFQIKSGLGPFIIFFLKYFFPSPQPPPWWCKIFLSATRHLSWELANKGKTPWPSLPLPLYHNSYHQQSTIFALKYLWIADTNNI